MKGREQLRILETGVRRVRNVGGFVIGSGSIVEVPGYVDRKRTEASIRGEDPRVVYLIDEFFTRRPELLESLGVRPGDRVEFVPTMHEPTTVAVDETVTRLRGLGFGSPAVVIGVGGGTTMDTAKAVANLLTNPGLAEQYQGWDLVEIPAVHKVAVPTLSGTGAEATRTCVMTNPTTGLKLGMNSDHTVFDWIAMDPELSQTVPADQFFFTGMDAYIHCVESLQGSYRNPVGDALCRETISLCRSVFLDGDMMRPEGRELMMVASYLGGCAIGMGYVGLVHPLSAGLSVVLGLHHCVANCIVMRAMEEFYPEAYSEFWTMAERQGISVPSGVAGNLSANQYRSLYQATIVHEKPLANALGASFRDTLTPARITDLFKIM